MSKAPFGLLHIYGQECWHGEASIVGNATGLRALRRAISKAIAEGKAETSECVSDGEGYSLHVVCNDSDWEDEFWTHLQMPYTEDWARGPEREGEIAPWELLKS